LEEAAKLLDYSASGLRKIVNRTKAGGEGPQIRFFQVGNGPIKFQKEWIEEFVAANTTGPKDVMPMPSHKAAVKRREPSGANHGFDPTLFRRRA
jgi:hypothetical protein